MDNCFSFKNLKPKMHNLRRQTNAFDERVRKAREEDWEQIHAIASKAFPFLLKALLRMTISRRAFVAEDENGRIIGAISFKVINVGNQNIGVAEWAMVDPQHQGEGLGKALMTKLLTQLQNEGCDEAATTDVDGYNSASWNTCYSCGFRYWPLSQQLHDFGWRLPKLWLKIPHIAPGAFLLHLSFKEKERKQKELNEWLTFVAAILLVGFFLLPLSQMRETLWQGFNFKALLSYLELRNLLVGTAVVALYMTARMLVQRLAARALNVPLTFRVWDSGFAFATLLALVFSPFIPAYAGSVYVKRDRFNYARNLSVMGKIMLAAVVVSMILFASFSTWAELSGASNHSFARIGRFVGFSFGITDTLFIFAPFQAVSAGHLWLWRRDVWLAVLLVFLFVWLLLPRFF